MVDTKSSGTLFRCERSEGKSLRGLLRAIDRLRDSDLCFENHSGCYIDEEQWRKKQKLGYELGGHLRPNIMVARTIEEAMGMERRDGTVSTCQWTES